MATRYSLESQSPLSRKRPLKGHLGQLRRFRLDIKKRHFTGKAVHMEWTAQRGCLLSEVWFLDHPSDLTPFNSDHFWTEPLQKQRAFAVATPFPVSLLHLQHVKTYNL